jgi:hypothetical protein
MWENPHQETGVPIRVIRRQACLAALAPCCFIVRLASRPGSQRHVSLRSLQCYIFAPWQFLARERYGSVIKPLSFSDRIA